MMKRERIHFKQAEMCIDVYHNIPIRFVDVELSEALKIAKRFKIYAYDAYLLACADQYKTPLLTLDGALKVHAKEMDIPILGE